MRIFYIEFENYRQYKNKQKIVFSDDSTHNFTVIQGANGAGKTNLLNGITWCLYGKELHFSKKYIGLPIINEKKLFELKEGEEIEASVKIVLGDEKPYYIFKRSIKGIKNNEKFNYIEQPLNGWFLLNNDWKESSSPTITLNGLLPEGIKNFFFFDGERLDDFFKIGNDEEIKKAILSVSQIDLLDTAIGHINDKKIQIEKEADGLSLKAKELVSKIDSAKKPLEINRVLLGDLIKQKTDTATNLSDIEEKLREYSIPLVSQLQNERDNLKRTIDTIDSQKYSVREKSIEHLISLGPLVYGRDAVSTSLEIINKKYQRGELPPKIRNPFLRELLEKGECICGGDISSGRSREKIEQLLTKVSLSEIDSEINTGKFQLEQMKKEIDEFITKRDEYGSEIRNLDEINQKNRERLKEISSKIEKTNIEEIQLWENQRIQFQKVLQTLEGDIRITKSEIERAETLIQEWEKEYRKELEKEKKHQTLLKKLNLCEDALKILKQMKMELISEVRETIESKTKEYFLNLIWKKDTYSEVKIDNNYRVSVLSKLGSESLGSLSAGERQILALSFMAALKEISGFDMPVIIDTPLGRISGEPKDNVAESLPEYLTDTQVTLLVTDQEYTPSVKKLLSKRIGKEYELKFNEIESETQVIETEVSPYAE